MTTNFRDGIVVRPYERLNTEEIRSVDEASLAILENPGIICFNEEALDLFVQNGCTAERRDNRSHTVSVPASVIRRALSTTPPAVKLGARDPKNSLLLDSRVPRIYFGSGSETNIWLDTHISALSITLKLQGRSGNGF